LELLTVAPVLGAPKIAHDLSYSLQHRNRPVTDTLGGTR
jgi:hypothetical protein